jgi:hypothetical protein
LRVVRIVFFFKQSWHVLLVSPLHRFLYVFFFFATVTSFFFSLPPTACGFIRFVLTIMRFQPRNLPTNDDILPFLESFWQSLVYFLKCKLSNLGISIVT